MIHIKNLYKGFSSESGHKIMALQNINLKINRGETIILEGPNGSGKSTLLSIIAGLTPPDSGEVRVSGELISKLPDLYSSRIRRDKIGFIFQEFNLMEDLSVSENLIIPLIPGKLKEEEIALKKSRTLSEFKLTEINDKRVKYLSGGEKQRVAIARASINDPELILADEPSSQIDKERKELLLSYFTLLKKQGTTIIIATHDPYLINLNIIDRIVRLDSGRLIAK